MLLAELNSKIKTKTARLAVIGLGYVGLPVAAMFADKGFNVLGVELRTERVQIVNSGRNPIEGNEPGLADLIRRTVSAGTLRASSNYDDLKGRDIILIDVETPVNDQHIPEYDALRSVLKSLGPVLKEGALVIVESTIAPGTMNSLVRPLLEQSSGKQLNRDFFLGNCPERVMPGKLLANLQKLSRVVGGGSQETAATMIKLYCNVVKADLDASDWITAELVKTVENSYRDVQIAFANEVALICEALNADVWLVRDLVRKSPGREMLKPGAGVGGHCIPKDPWLLASSVKGLNANVRLIPVAREINAAMPHHMLELIRKRLDRFNDKKILLLGYAYLENSDDTRNSPAEALTLLLRNEGAQVVNHDPYVQDFIGDIYQKANGCDAVVLITAHADYENIDFKALKKALRYPLVIDGRNLWKKDRMLQAGLEIIRLGDFSQ